MTEAEIQIEVQASRSQGASTEKLKRHIFGLVGASLEQHYRGNYSIRCFQSSILINEILNRLGIKSVIVLGAVCVPGVKSTYPHEILWNGFWGEDHHIWIFTEFYEIVDFTISQLHLHPVNQDSKLHKIPPIWWCPTDSMPTVFKYLHSGNPVQLDPEYHDDMEKLKQVLMTLSVNGTTPLFSEFVLTGPESLDRLYNDNDLWAVAGVTIQSLPLPEWIIRREQELLAPYIN